MLNFYDLQEIQLLNEVENKDKINNCNWCFFLFYLFFRFQVLAVGVHLNMYVKIKIVCLMKHIEKKRPFVLS